jgi:hypothetical protein
MAYQVIAEQNHPRKVSTSATYTTQIGSWVASMCYLSSNAGPKSDHLEIDSTDCSPMFLGATSRNKLDLVGLFWKDEYRTGTSKTIVDYRQAEGSMLAA